MDDGARITEALMRDALLGAGTAVWAWDVPSDRLSNTDASAALLGYAPGEVDLTQAAWNQLIHPDDLAENHAAYLRHARGETAFYEHEYRALAKDGSWRWVAERGQVVERAPDGEPLRMVGTLSDITLRRDAQGTALEMAERLRKISRHVPGIVFQYRSRPGELSRGFFPFVSESVIDLLGVSPHGLMEDAGAFFRMVEREDREQLERSIVDSGRMMRPWRCDFRIFRRGVPPRWMSGTATPQAEPDGTVTWHGYLQDVTDERELDRAHEAAAAAQAANRAKTEFLSRMSHELRTPLNAVLGFAQLLELDSNAPLNETQRRRVELIREAGAHLLQMIGELLDLTRIETGQLAVTLAALPLAPLLADCIEFVRAQADAAGVVLHFDAEDTPWSARADATRLRQVVLNLLGNAVKYNRPGGSVRLRVRADRDLVVLLVSDTGVGIAAADLSTLFEPFHRGAHQHSTIEGTGIGLAVTRALVELMGGRIDVVSVPGQGSTFSVTLAAA